MRGGTEEAPGTPRDQDGGNAGEPLAQDPGVAAVAPIEAAGARDPAADAVAGAASAREATRFAHASEAEMARILDFYQVRWEYEPTTFPILWNLDGDVVESFAPDFYLPDLEVFLEMTTLKQRLVRKKNRKLRRLRELYPDIRIKLFYARDFRAMMLKYGRLGLAESLSGTPGQVVPEKAAPPTEPMEPVGERAPAPESAPAPAANTAPDNTAPTAEAAHLPAAEAAAPEEDPADARTVAQATIAPPARRNRRRRRRSAATRETPLQHEART